MKNIHEVVKNTFMPTEEMVQVPVEMLEYIMNQSRPLKVRAELIKMLEAAPATLNPNGRVSVLSRLISMEDKLREMRGFLQVCILHEMMQNTPTVEEEMSTSKVKPEEEDYRDSLGDFEG